MEIERKFLITDKNAINNIIKNYTKKEIVQDYLYIDYFTAIRKRKIVTGSIKKYFYTVKTMKTGLSVNEIEKEITQDEYDKLKLNLKYNSIIKDRYIIPYLENLKIEFDLFHGIYEGISFAEIEFKNEEEARNTKLPDWFEKDISNFITNSQMAMENIKDDILKFM